MSLPCAAAIVPVLIAFMSYQDNVSDKVIVDKGSKSKGINYFNRIA
jgi:hypothetical protein